MSNPKQNGALVISLDFELYWGVRDVRRIENYRETILGERLVVPALLKLFHEYHIHATWATVGFMFCETREDLIRESPGKKPRYTNQILSPYPHLNHIGRDEQEDPFHYAPSLIKLIASSAHQEVASHTFSHYYCLEKGQDIETFSDDLLAAKKVASRYKINMESLVFPRNQFNGEYLSVCKELGFKAYRGNECSWIYRAKSREHESLFRRAVRLLDAYMNISGHNCYSLEEVPCEVPVNIPSSRFLRPFSKRLRLLEPLRMRRILADLTYAAKHGLIYHLWWHPHNFGDNTEDNLAFLKTILDHYLSLKQTYAMESLNMGELSQSVVDRNGSRYDSQLAGTAVQLTHGL
ncbi:MAG: polysaccharide deacetylase family protein [Nitrospirales bacterium]